MAENKFISELSGITISGLTLTGNTVYDDGNTTFKLPLGELATYIGTIDGDYVTTSSFNSFTSSTNTMFTSLNPVLSSLQTSTGSLNAFTSSLNSKTGTFATTGSNIFNGQQTIKSSVTIGPSGSLHTDNPEILHVNNSGSFNIAHFEGNSDTYLQVNIKNTNSSAGSSTDFVATADNGTEDLHYVNMGINSSGFNTPFSVGYQNDAYLINRGRDLYIGSLDGPDYDHTHVHLFSSNSWQNPQISIISDAKIGFNTGSVTTGYTYEFSGSVKMNDNIKIDGISILSQVSSSLNFTNDSQAQLGGVPLGGLYRSGGFVMIRLT